MKSLSFLFLLFFFFLVGCPNMQAPSNDYTKLKEEISQGLSQSGNPREEVLAGIERLQDYLKSHPKSRYTRDVDYYVLYLTFQHLSKESDFFFSICQNFAKKYPRDVRTPVCYYRMGEFAYYRGQYQKALKHFDHLIESFPRYPKRKEAFLWKILIAYETAEYQKCRQACEAFLKIWPKDKEAKRIDNFFEKANFALKWKDKEAPTFSMKDVLNRRVEMKSFRGNVVFLVFWSLNQQDREKMFSFKDLYKKYGGRNFRLAAIALTRGGTPQRIRQRLEDHLVPSLSNWIHFYESHGFSSPLARAYGVKKTPTNFLIDQKGKIRGVDLWGKALNQAIEKLLE